MLHEQPKCSIRRSGNGSWSRWGVFRGGLPLVNCFVFATLVSHVERVDAQTPKTESAVPGSVFSSPEQARSTIQSLVDLILPKLPRSYSSDKHWEKRKRVWAGVDIDRDGLRLKTKRRWREVRHGRWTRYEVRFPGDENSPPPVEVEIREVTPELNEFGQLTWVIESETSAPLDFTARIERWNLGAKWYTFTVTGHMKVGLTVRSSLSSRLDYSEIPPAIVIDLEVNEAALRLDEFNVDRVSKVGGEVAEQWGKIAQKVAEEILLDDLDKKLAEKLNRSIEKRREDLRFSAASLFQNSEKSAEPNAEK